MNQKNLMRKVGVLAAAESRVKCIMRAGFTLIELLVVIAIIAILAANHAIGLPAS